MTGLRRIVTSPVLASIVAALVIGAIMLAATGADPIAGYRAILTSSLGAGNIGGTLDQAIPYVGMAVALAIPLRANLINLGGDGQLVIGAIATMVVGQHCPLPGPVTLVLAILAGMLAGGLYAAVAAVLENVTGVPLLITSLLLGYVGQSVASYLARYPLKAPGVSLPETRQLPAGVHLPGLGSSATTVGLLLIIAVIVVFVVVDARTTTGYEIRMSGLNARFTSYAGVNRQRMTVRLLFVSGAVTGLVGAIMMTSFPYRFIDGALIDPSYTWIGLMAALLAGAVPIGAVLAGLFFAVLQVGGLGMEQATRAPRELTMVLQALIIVFLAARVGMFRRRRARAAAAREASARDEGTVSR